MRQQLGDIQAQRQLLEAVLMERTPLVEGSLVVVRKVCGKAGCRCARSRRERHGPFLYLSLSRQGRTRTIHLPKRWEEPVRVGVEAARHYRKTHKEWHALATRLEALWKQVERHRKHSLPYEPKQKSR